MKAIRLLSCLFVILLLFSACGGKTETPGTTRGEAPGITGSEPGEGVNTTLSSGVQSTAAQTKKPDVSQTATKKESTTQPTKQSNTTTTTKTTKEPETKAKEMVFTDNANNKFIQAIVKKYKVDPKLLAGIYITPPGDNNVFWEFNGEKDANGKLIRTEETLVMMYVVFEDCSKVIRTDGVKVFDGFTQAVGKSTFNATTALVLPLYEKELAG